MPKGHPISVTHKPWEATRPPIDNSEERLKAYHDEGLTVNACGHWTSHGNPIRHTTCKNLPPYQCHYQNGSR